MFCYQKSALSRAEARHALAQVIVVLVQTEGMSGRDSAAIGTAKTRFYRNSSLPKKCQTIFREGAECFFANLVSCCKQLVLDPTLGPTPTSFYNSWCCLSKHQLVYEDTLRRVILIRLYQLSEFIFVY